LSIIDQKLYFVYELWNPIKNEPFYVGKGHGDRPYAHITEEKSNTSRGNQHKLYTIRQILRSKEEVDVRTVFEGFNEKETTDKISKARKGKPWSPARRKAQADRKGG